MCVCVCVCVCMKKRKENYVDSSRRKQRGREKQEGKNLPFLQ